MLSCIINIQQIVSVYTTTCLIMTLYKDTKCDASIEEHAGAGTAITSGSMFDGLGGGAPFDVGIMISNRVFK